MVLFQGWVSGETTERDVELVAGSESRIGKLSVEAALAAGTASIGKLGANSGVDIGDVTVNNTVGAAVPVQPGTGAVFSVSVAAPAAIVHGQKTVATAGTEEALGSSTALTSGVRIKALHANTGWVYVGANPVTSTTGFVLDAGEEVFLEVANLATVYIDVSVNGEGVSYIGA